MKPGGTSFVLDNPIIFKIERIQSEFFLNAQMYPSVKAFKKPMHGFTSKEWQVSTSPNKWR